MRLPVCLCVGLAFLLTAPPAAPHSVIVDGDPVDWSLASSPSDNLGHLRRSASLEGEYVWKDAGGDEKTDFASPDTDVDMLDFAITSDADYLYILIRMAGITVASGSGSPMVQIAIDTNPALPGVGQLPLGGFADTQVASAAAWEFLVMTRFGSGSATPRIYNTSFADVAVAGQAVEAIDATLETIEIRVPWGHLGLYPLPSSLGPLRFTVATFRSDAFDDAWDIGGSSDALDVLSNYGDPGSTGHTNNEVGDGIVDYHFDVWFLSNEPASPLLISEVLYDPAGTDSQEEWIELVNATGSDLSLVGFKVGDEESADGTEGMLTFPAGTPVGDGQAVVVAADRTAFAASWGSDPDYEYADLSTTPEWSAGSIILGNSADEVLVLDGRYTVVDVLTYGTATYPGTVSHPDVPEGSSIERATKDDTDDAGNDFREQTTPNPGTPASAATADIGVTVVDSPDPVLAGQNLTYSVSVSNAGPDDAGVLLADTLPATTTFVSAIPDQGTCSHDAGVVDCDLLTIQSGTQEAVTITVVPQSEGSLSNTATVSSAASDPVPANNTDTTLTTVLDGAIGNLAWHDTDGDGIQDAGEPGAMNVLVALYDGAGTPLDSVFTAADGTYVFGGLFPENDYRLRFFAPEGFVLTQADAGSDDELDSDADPVTLTTPTFTLLGPLDASRWDVGVIPFCVPPDESLYISGVSVTPDGNQYPVLTLMDPNQPSQITGYNVYRSSDPALPIGDWPLEASEIVDMDEGTPNIQWIDSSGDVSPTGVWYYQVAGYNSRCPAEGPF